MRCGHHACPEAIVMHTVIDGLAISTAICQGHEFTDTDEPLKEKLLKGFDSEVLIGLYIGLYLIPRFGETRGNIVTYPLSFQNSPAA